eukprot:482933-Alexandrium_andersonii.AAC.1
MLPRPRPAGVSAHLPPRQAPQVSAIVVSQKPSSQPEAPASGSLRLRSMLVMSLEFHMEKTPDREAVRGSWAARLGLRKHGSP